MKTINDGSIATDLLSWTDCHHAVVPLAQSDKGKPLCPLCSTDGYVETLYLSAASRRYSCTRKHLFVAS